MLRTTYAGMQQPPCPREPGMRGLLRTLPGVAYRSDAVNFAHVPAVNARVPPSRSVVSRTRIVPSSLAVSTHASPPLALKLDLRQLPACFPIP